MSRREHNCSRELIQQRKRDEARAVMRSLEGLEIDEATHSPRPAGERAAAQPQPPGEKTLLIPPFTSARSPLSAERHIHELEAAFGPDQTAQQSEVPSNRPGPRTAAGKAAARGNAIKHGLSGAGKVLPEDMRLEVERLETAFRAEFPPSTESENIAVRNLALATVRADRCAKLEASLVERNRMRDLVKFDVDQKLAAERLGQKLFEAPAETVLELRGSVAGCAWLITRWQRLLAGLRDGICQWKEPDVDRACLLLGTPREEWHLDLTTLLLRQSYEIANGHEPERATRVRAALRDRVTEEINRLEQELSQLQECEEFDRLLLQEDLRFDTSPEVEKLRRLARDADRLFSRSFRFLIERGKARAALERDRVEKSARLEPLRNPAAMMAEFRSRMQAAVTPAPIEANDALAQNECPGAQNENAAAQNTSDPAERASLPMPSATFLNRERPLMAIAAQAPPIPEPLAPALAS